MNLAQQAVALVLACACAAVTAQSPAQIAAPEEEPADWSHRTSLEVWAYGGRTAVRDDALLNPGNRIAAIPHSSAWLDGRLNLRADNGAVQWLLAPRLTEQQGQIQQAGIGEQTRRTGAARMGQSFVRYQSGDTALTLGRELFVWGPANFRSPSSPFYFDAGRANPLAATPGIDLLRGTQGLGSFRLTAAHVVATSQLQPAQDSAQTNLLKLDQQGASHLASLIVSQQRGGSPFVGAFAQVTPDDAWLLYAEFGSTRPTQLASASPVPRTSNSLVGASYTLENGQTLVAEVLHNTGGFTSAQSHNYFQQAALAGVLAQTQPAAGYGALGQALGTAPRLMGRDYVWLNWQSNPQESGLLWRAGWTQNLSDRSGQAMVYLEKNWVPKLSGFLAVTLNRGSPQTEYGMLWRSSITAGVKWFAF